MKEEIKYCKFCDEEKPIKEFVKSGGFIKNICRKCQNEKQKKIYSDSKKVRLLEAQLKAKEEVIKEAREYIKEHIRIDDEYPAYMEMLITERDELDEILSKGENDQILK